MKETKVGAYFVIYNGRGAVMFTDKSQRDESVALFIQRFGVNHG